MEIARMSFCSYYYTPYRGDRTNVMHNFVGRESNATSAQLIAEFVVKSILKQAKAEAKDSFDPHFAKTFCMGAYLKIRDRVTQLIKDGLPPEEQGLRQPGTALVLASLYASEETENKALIAQSVSLRTAPVRKIQLGGHEALERGKEYGGRVSLSRQLNRG